MSHSLLIVSLSGSAVRAMLAPKEAKGGCVMLCILSNSVHKVAVNPFFSVWLTLLVKQLGQ